jgi:hypothetical protein
VQPSSRKESMAAPTAPIHRKSNMSKSNNSNASKKENPSTGIHGTKDNSECASLRLGATPKPEKVRELPLVDKENKAAKHAADQNSSLAPGGKSVQNVVPSGNNFPTVVSSGN